MKATGTVLAGSVLGGILASACCLVPVVFALLGLSGAALAHSLEPLRLYLLTATYGLLAGGFYLTYRAEPQACPPGESCAAPGGNRLGRVMLWLVAIVVLLATTFPWYSQYLFQ
jgi:mercuric ion transport protein